MSNDNLDAETKTQLSRAQALDALFKSSGWKFAEEELFDFIAELKDISTIDLESDTAQQIRDRKNLAESLLEWVETLKSQVNNAIIIESNHDNKIIERR